MSLLANFDVKERVRAAVDIVDVIGRELELRPQGSQFVARCPFHNDKRPSMTVNQSRQTWKCWVCDIGGDIFSYVMRREGLDFPAALRLLADQAGIPIEEITRGKKTKPGDPNDRDTLFSAIKLVSDAYFDVLDAAASSDAKLARDYLRSRGIDEESRQRFRIGFAPDEWSFAVDRLTKGGYSTEVAVAAGLVKHRDRGDGAFDFFRGRLMFPIHDLQNRPISMGGRVLPEIVKRWGEGFSAGKYVNGRETMLFRKSQQLYGLQLARDAIRQQGEALVMEGYTDVIAARQAGIEPVVAVLGTALTEPHIKTLKRFAQRVVLVLDGDVAGQNRADEVTELFVKADVDVRVMTLPDGSDPADFIQAHGKDEFLKLAAASPDALDHKLFRLTDGVDLTRDTHQVSTAVTTLLKILAKAPESAGVRRDQMLVRLAKTFELSPERLQRQLDSLTDRTDRRSGARRAAPRHSGQRPATPRRSPSVADPNQLFAESATDLDEFGIQSARPEAPARDIQPKLASVMGIDRELFETLIENPELAAMAVEAIDPDWLETTTAKMLLSVYQDLELNGRELDWASVLLV
ncbi:MAG: DNA primase, partial [Planctomycetota bacterium]